MTPDELRAAIRACGLTQLQAADALDVNPHTLQQWLAPPGPKNRAVNPVAARVLAWAAARGGFPDDWPHDKARQP